MQQPDERGKVPLQTAQPEQRLRRPRSGVQAQPLQQNEQQMSIIDFDRAYFDCYAHLGVHEEMIKDSVRTEAYKEAIIHHQDFIKDKVVLDVGCGTGILSIFCAQAGAKKVYAVEASSIAEQASSVVQDNNLSDVVMVLHGRVEDIEINEKVDVIISEWMGYMLLHESMLGSVITARDRWLKSGGLILPSNALLYMAPITHTKRYRESIDFWRNVHEINMSALLPIAKQQAFYEPSVETITSENVLTWPNVVVYHQTIEITGNRALVWDQAVKDINCYTITIPELESVTTPFKFNSKKKAPLHGFAFWFDVEFSGRGQVLSPDPISFLPPTSPVHNHPVDINHSTLILSTGPAEPPTHWQQTLIYLYDPIELEQDQLIEGKVILSQSQMNPRFLNISIEYHTGGNSYVKMTVMY